MFLEIKDVKKSYGKDTSYIQVLKGISTTDENGHMCGIQGTSGSVNQRCSTVSEGSTLWIPARLRLTGKRYSA